MRPEKGFAFAGRARKLRAWFFNGSVQSKSGAPPAGAPKPLLSW
jgi:hypothetical protein